MNPLWVPNTPLDAGRIVTLLLLTLACSPEATLPAADSSAAVDSETVPSTDSEGTSQDSTVPGNDTEASKDSAPTELLCDPAVETSPIHALEGDTVVMALSCATGESLADFEVTLVNAPASSVFDLETGQLAWTTDLDDGGKHEIVFSLRPTVGSGGEFPESTIGTVWVADNKDHPDNISVDPASYTEEWGLPVLHVDPVGQLSEEYVPARCTFQTQEYSCTIKIRGAASAGYPKNSYTLEFEEEHLDASDYGLPNKDHLILITSFDDNSYTRQKLVYDMWLQMAEFYGVQRLTPRTFFTVLYLDGRYHGLYTAIDRIDNQFVDQMGFTRDCNLYKAVNHDANFYWTASDGAAKSNLTTGYDRKEGDVSDWSDLGRLVSFTGGPNTETFLASADEYIVQDEFMDWFLLVHYTASDDSGGKNSYLYNDPTDFLFRYAPWDFNHSFGQTWQTIRFDASVNNDFTWTNAVFAHHQSDADASAVLWARFHEMVNAENGPLNPDWLRETLDAYYALIDSSAERDWDDWRESYRSYWWSVRNSCSDCLEYPDERQYLYDWLRDRHVWMQTYHPPPE